MFKLAVFAAVLAVAFAYPGGLTGYSVSYGAGPISAPAVVKAAPTLIKAPVIALAAPAPVHAAVIAQPLSPVVHSPPVLTSSYVAHAPLGLH
ncbi:uncharacterized protein [Polyergus mexicanus]|uniref:uncharacterized protein n=1 Tax=Polyergus mexicanus TaxID=615972 RepID=UPI0038B617E2